MTKLFLLLIAEVLRAPTARSKLGWGSGGMPVGGGRVRGRLALYS
jgi:hypothetical protein